MINFFKKDDDLDLEIEHLEENIEKIHKKMNERTRMRLKEMLNSCENYEKLQEALSIYAVTLESLSQMKHEKETKIDTKYPEAHQRNQEFEDLWNQIIKRHEINIRAIDNQIEECKKIFFGE